MLEEAIQTPAALPSGEGINEENNDSVLRVEAVRHHEALVDDSSTSGI